MLQQLKQQGIKPSNTTYGLVMEVDLMSSSFSSEYQLTFKKSFDWTYSDMQTVAWFCE